MHVSKLRYRKLSLIIEVTQSFVFFFILTEECPLCKLIVSSLSIFKDHTSIISNIIVSPSTTTQTFQYARVRPQIINFNLAFIK